MELLELMHLLFTHWVVRSYAFTVHTLGC